MPNLVGIGLSQVPTNSMLGGLAYQDPEHASIKNLDLKNLSQINSEIADTAVDVFIYDTSKDSDGGAWRKRTTYTSWYNETLGTATRGSRKEFPAVAVIVVETTKVTIYDGDDPDLPMWMVFNTTSGNLIGAGTLRGVTALNGIVVTAASGYTMETRFISDYSLDWFTNQLYEYKGNIEQRHDTLGFKLIESYGIVNSASNDVAMTVLPNAPIDSATGLPVPTIAVATNGGLSVITDSGSVFDDATSAGIVAGVESCAFSGTKIVCCRGGASGNKVYVQDASTISADFTSERMYRVSQYGETNEVQHVCHNLADIDEVEGSDDNLILGAEEGIAIINENLNSPTNGLVAKIASDYNTGWMYGNNKGAFLSDTDTTNITGSEKIANYNFAADFSTQWEAQNNANTSYDAANDRVTVTSTQNYSGITLKNASLPTLTEGKRYIMTVDVHSITNPIRFGVVSGGTKDSVNSTGAHTLMFTAGASISEVFVQKPSGSNSTFVLNSVSIREAEEDRSVNNNGFQVLGTITKSAVATGADLVAYGPFANSNYLKQPYHSGMDFGTGDMSVSFWMKIDGNISGTAYVYDRQGSNGNRHAIYLASGNSGSLFFYFYSGGGVETYATNLNDHKDKWVCYTCNRNSSGLVEIYMNGQLRGSATLAVKNLTNTSAETFIGTRHSAQSSASQQIFALFKFSATIPSPEQIKKIYEDEKVLFQENAKATLYGSSDAVTALAYDKVTDQLHVGTSSGRSDFQGLRRINNTTTAVTTAISAHDEFIIEQ